MSIIINNKMTQNSSGIGSRSKLRLKKKILKSWAVTSVAIGDIDGAFEGATEQNSDDPFASVLGDPIVVVDDAEKNKWVHNNLLDGSR